MIYFSSRLTFIFLFSYQYSLLVSCFLFLLFPFLLLFRPFSSAGVPLFTVFISWFHFLFSPFLFSSPLISFLPSPPHSLDYPSYSLLPCPLPSCHYLFPSTKSSFACVIPFLSRLSPFILSLIQLSHPHISVHSLLLSYLSSFSSSSCLLSALFLL